MTTVGIINPSWTLSRHNTDQRCVMDLLEMNKRNNNITFCFAGSDFDYIGANINLLFERLFKYRPLKSINITDNDTLINIYYKYGGDILGLNIKTPTNKPLISTLGFPTLNQDRDKGYAYLKRHANDLVAFGKDSDLIHFHTDCMRESFLEFRPEWASKCITVPFYLPHLKICSESSIYEKFSKSSTQIVFVGNGKYKGLADLCDALDKIADYLATKNVVVKIVSKQRPTCAKFNKIEHIASLPRDDVQKLMQESHIFAMVPYRESFGLVYVEAMAAGCVVISDDDIPRQEILDGGKCGRLVSPGNSTALAKEIQLLIENRDLAMSFALNGRERAQNRYAPEVAANQYSSMFQKIASQ